MPENMVSFTIIVTLEGTYWKRKKNYKQNIPKNISSTNAPRKYLKGLNCILAHQLHYYARQSDHN